jgi:hypothetical protein
MNRTISAGAVLLVLMGCLNGPAKTSNDPSDIVRMATTQYARDLADTADEVATKSEANVSLSSAEVFASFQTASRAARERFNAAVGGALDKRSPPTEPMDPAAWRDLARGLRDAVR